MTTRNVITMVEIHTAEVQALRTIVEFHLDDDDEYAIQIREILAGLLAKAELALERA